MGGNVKQLRVRVALLLTAAAIIPACGGGSGGGGGGFANFVIAGIGGLSIVSKGGSASNGNGGQGGTILIQGQSGSEVNSKTGALTVTTSFTVPSFTVNLGANPRNITTNTILTPPGT